MVQLLGHKKSRKRLFFNNLRLSFCGERGIRTPGTVIPYVSLANWWFQPLTHLTKTVHFTEWDCKYIKILVIHKIKL